MNFSETTNVDNKLLEYVENSGNIFTVLAAIDNSELIKNIITELKPKFRKLDIEVAEESFEDFEDICKYICESQAYALNYDMVLKILSINGNLFSPEEKLAKTPYSSIKKSGLKCLISRVDENLNSYINEMLTSEKLASVSGEWTENNEQTKFLLQHDDIEKDTKLSFLKRNTGKINLNDLLDSSFWETAIIYSRIFANWENLILYYNHKEKEVTNELVDFINSHISSQGLQKSIPEKVLEEDESLVVDFEVALLNTNRLKNEAHLQIAKSAYYCYSATLFDVISTEKIENMCATNIFEFRVDNYEFLDNISKKAALLFINNNMEGFINNIDDIKLTTSNYQSIVDSDILSDSKKRSIVEARRIILNADNEDDVELSVKIIGLYSDEKIPRHLTYLVTFRVPYSSTKEIDVMLSSLGHPFSKLTITNRHKVKIPISNDNSNLMEALTKTKPQYIRKPKQVANNLEVYTPSKPRK